MIKDKLTANEIKLLTFHLQVVGYHKMMVDEVIKSVGYGRLKYKPESNVGYDIPNREIWEEPIKKD